MRNPWTRPPSWPSTDSPIENGMQYWMGRRRRSNSYRSHLPPITLTRFNAS